MISRPASVYTLEYSKKIFLALMFKEKPEANIETLLIMRGVSNKFYI